MSKISTSQIDQAQLTLAIQQASSGSAFSGNVINYVSNGGWLGNNVLNLSGGAQTALGPTTFSQAISIPYAAGTGQTVARLYVDQNLASVSGALNAALNAISGAVESGNSAFTVTGSTLVSQVDFSGLGGTLVFLSGNKVFFSGAGGGAGGGSNVLVTGSSAISTPNLTGAGSVTLTYDGTFVRISGAPSAGGAPNAVFTTGVNLLTGISYTFTGSPLVAAPTLPSGAVNLVYLSGFSGVMTGLIQSTSGVLTAQLVNLSGVLTGLNQATSGILVARDLAISGALQAQIGGGSSVTNNFFITGTGTINNTFNASGSITNTFTDNSINIGTITGNFVDMSFFSDPVATGLNVLEAFVSHNFFFTGAAFACRTTGSGPTNGGILSGKLYQVDLNNTEQNLYTFTFQSGVIYSGSPTFATLVTGGNRVGLSIFNTLSGIEKFSVGVFGGGYV